MFIRVLMKDGYLDVTPEVASELVRQKEIFQCDECGLCHPVTDCSVKDLRDRVAKLVN